MRCPICKAEFAKSASDAPPFCSERCQLIDLGRWLGESYTLPRIPDPESDEQPDDQQPTGDLADVRSVDASE